LQNCIPYTLNQAFIFSIYEKLKDIFSEKHWPHSAYLAGASSGAIFTVLSYPFNLQYLFMKEMHGKRK
jgi:hypothetical protein